MAKMEQRVEVLPLNRNPDSNKTNLETMVKAMISDGYIPGGAFSFGGFAYVIFTMEQG